MHKKVFKILALVIAIFAFFMVSKVNAVELDENENNYQIVIEDDANLLTDGEERELRTIMEGLTEYGNVIFKTTNTENSYSSLKYIQNYYYSKFKNNSGVAFYIDMKNRQLCACATGGLDDIITSAKCDTIMDNVYRYASNKNYYMCASETYTQMNKLLLGQKIAETMKYICNAIVSVMLSLFASYGLFILLSGSKKASQKELISECEVSFQHSPIDAWKTGTHSEYSPRSESSSSGGSSSSSRRRRRWRLLRQWRKPWILKIYIKRAVCFLNHTA